MDKRFWVGFNLVKGIGAVRLQALQSHFGDLEIAWQAPQMPCRRRVWVPAWRNDSSRSAANWT